MPHKYNLCFAVIFEKEELDCRGRPVILYLQFCTDNISLSNIFERFKTNSKYNFSVELPLTAPVIAKAVLYSTDSISKTDLIDRKQHLHSSDEVK